MRKSPKLQLSRWFSEINPYCYISLLPWITLASIDDVLASLVFGFLFTNSSYSFSVFSKFVYYMWN
uniref:Uncharacterized protein n=1 Tax=Helianthus annuus TaxID=4232 RepID=A0A251RXU4_HELAN